MAKPTRKSGFLGKNMTAHFESYQLARFRFTILFWHVTVTQLHPHAWVRDNHQATLKPRVGRSSLNSSWTSSWALIAFRLNWITLRLARLKDTQLNLFRVKKSVVLPTRFPTRPQTQFFISIIYNWQFWNYWLRSIAILPHVS